MSDPAHAAYRPPSPEPGAGREATIRRLVTGGALLLAVAGSLPAAEGPTLVRPASGFGVSRPLAEIAASQAVFVVPPRPAEWEKVNKVRPKSRRRAGASRDAALQIVEPAATAIPAPTLTFEGLSSSNNLAIFGSRPIPPDPVGDVGPDHYVQMVNTLVRVYAKTGTPLTPFFAISDLFAGIGPPCAGQDGGDPIVLYDPLADRWLVSELCIETTAALEHQLIALSTSGDPTGSYFVYDFQMPNIKANDYPHFGVWPDAYYMTNNQFVGNTFAGAGAFAFDRKKMLAGDPTASYVYFDQALIDPAIGGQLPTDLDGAVPPPPGAPNLFFDIRADEFGDPTDALRVFEFQADFDNPASSTFTARPDVALAAFDPRDTGNRGSVAQPPPAGSSELLDSLAFQMMHRVAYRALAGGVQSYVMNFTVNVSGVDPTGDSNDYQAGIRWVELRRDAGTGAVTVADQGTYAPGAGVGAAGRDIWMGSIAQDHQGNLAVGFSASSTTLFPSILYAGRLAGDPAGALSQGEATLFAGGGSQLSASNRWGDYSAMSVDPADECTFWYTNEYYAASSSIDWRTRIGSFKYTGCSAASKGTIQGTVTRCGSGEPLGGVLLTTPEGFVRATDAAGVYSFSVSPGSYTLTGTLAGFSPQVEVVTVSGGETVTRDFCLAAVPELAAGPTALQAEECPPPNGAIDPGETVTVNLCVVNLGAAATADLVGTLEASGGVGSPGAPQSFGVVDPGGTVCRPFTFTASGSCGSTLSATLDLQDGTSDLGIVTFDLSLGAPVVPLGENFDGVLAPAIPAGWTAANATGAAPLWRTVASSADTLPNAAFVNDPSTVADKRLTTPAFAVGTAGARVRFRNRFDLDEGFDGGVLEVSSPNINAGAFTDVTSAAVGGGFVEGGYTDTLATGFSNSLGGRPAWTGNTFGYRTTVANLGPAVAGQTIQLRWRMGSDNAIGGGGWWIDSIEVQDSFSCCSLPTFVGEPMAVDTQGGAGTSSDQDGVLQPGESAIVAPSWRNTGSVAMPLAGTASAFTGPPGASYTFFDTAADYGTIGGGAVAGCPVATGDCYGMTLSNPVPRPALHWDASFQESLSAGLAKTWALHVGDSFVDVPRSQPFYKKIETLLHSGITAGCGPSAFCPTDAVPRSQMAIFLARGIANGGAAVPAGGTLGGAAYFCGAGGVSLFSDVAPTDIFCKHVHYIAGQNVTLGCAPGLYCPSGILTRGELAAFVGRAVLAPGGAASLPLSYGPDPVTAFSYSCDPGSPNLHFTDVPASNPACRSAHFLWARGIIEGCSATQYCASVQVTRDQMSKFLANAFKLPLYPP